MTEGHQEPRSGRFSESEIVRKKESSRSNLIEREVGKEKEQPAEQQEVAYNSTSEEEEVMEEEEELRAPANFNFNPSFRITALRG